VGDRVQCVFVCARTSVRVCARVFVCVCVYVCIYTALKMGGIGALRESEFKVLGGSASNRASARPQVCIYTKKKVDDFEQIQGAEGLC